MAATLDKLKIHLGIPASDTHNDEAMQMWLDAANAQVAIWRPDLTATDPWDPRAEGAVYLQASKLVGRRGSVQGVAAFADIGVTYMPRLDPDLMTLLELGDYQQSVVA